jgi:hypothetical protein
MRNAALTQLLDILSALSAAVVVLLVLGLTIAALRYLITPSQDRRQAHAAHAAHIMGIGLIISSSALLVTWVVRLFSGASPYSTSIIQRLLSF